MTTPSQRDLRRLARFCGIKLDYWDVNGKLRSASEASLLGVLNALGHDLSSPDQAPGILKKLRLERWRKPLSPVSVAWTGSANILRIRLPEMAVHLTLKLTIALEDRSRIEKYARGAELLSRRLLTIDGEQFAVCEWPLPANLPPGYHTLTLEFAAREHRAHLIVAPPRCWKPQVKKTEKNWGVFLPLYALRTKNGMGSGDWKDFQRLTEWVDSLGGEVAATLPMLAGFLGNGPGSDEPGPYEYSPYSPASRLFLNEFYIDLEAIPELSKCEAARQLMQSEEFQREQAELNAAPLVDYRRQMALKRRVLELLAAHYTQSNGYRRCFGKHGDEYDDLSDYAQFRAHVEKTGTSWWNWSEPLSEGLPEDDLPEDQFFYHLYVQMIAWEQMTALAERARKAGGGLYLDLPLGVNSDSYDVWEYRDNFALLAAGGAPPDGFFSKGQNWGFPPIHPERSRWLGHDYFKKVIQRLMQFAGALRIDHVMGLHRLYWIPQGMEATEGLYVRSPAEELYAILALESHRHQCEVVGENLGTVPDAVNVSMKRHGVRGMHVMQFGVSGDWNNAIYRPSPGTVASVNTHDTASFAGWWTGRDLDLQLEMNLITPDQHRDWNHGREHVRNAIIHYLRAQGLLGEDASVVAVHAGCLKFLATSDSELLLINIEDLWGETEPQNVPGTAPAERPNWRRRAALPFETWTNDPELVKLLKDIDALRRAAR